MADDPKTREDGEDRSFDPSTPEANRTRQQGGGMGQRELSGQGDPDRDDYSQVVANEPAEALQEDDGSVEGMQQGRTNTNREFDDASDDIQGEKTTEANRDRVRGNPDLNP